jgi:DNA-binding transcriptional ArsR family regulator
MEMRELLAVTKALADANRVRMLLSLRGRELCVCQIIELFKLAPSTVSKHMWILSQARLVERRKEGRWMYYRQAGRDAPVAARAALRWVQQALTEDPQTQRDAKRLEAILKIDPEVLCRKQCKR